MSKAMIPARSIAKISGKRGAVLAAETEPSAVFTNRDAVPTKATRGDHACNGSPPELSVAVLADLGLTNREIARYLRLSEEQVMRLR
jgi:DNA-binding NarL/FixJ family response regulator